MSKIRPSGLKDDYQPRPHCPGCKRVVKMKKRKGLLECPLCRWQGPADTPLEFSFIHKRDIEDVDRFGADLTAPPAGSVVVEPDIEDNDEDGS